MRTTLRLGIFLGLVGAGANLAQAKVKSKKARTPVVETIRAEDAQVLRAEGIAAQPYSPAAHETAQPVEGWPTKAEREAFLREAPGFAHFALKHKWDAFQTDRFVFKARDSESVGLLAKAYPKIPRPVLEESLRAATKH